MRPPAGASPKAKSNTGAPRYYGALLQRRVVGMFVITESLFRGDSKLPPHSHDSAYLTFTLKGSYQEWYGPHSRVCTAGTGVAHPAREHHSQRFGRDPALLLRLAVDNVAGDESPIEVDAPAALDDPRLTRAVAQLHAELAGTGHDGALDELAYEVAALSWNRTAPGGSRRRAMRARTVLRSALRHPASLSDVARELGVSRATLYRDFKTAFACTPAEYVRRARIVLALRSLAASARPISEIAVDCGFYDQSHLDRAFRDEVGIAPSEFRARRSS